MTTVPFRLIGRTARRFAGTRFTASFGRSAHGRRTGLRPRISSLLARLHRDEGGTISIVSVFAAMLLAMLLGMLVNVGWQVDRKIRMQNAADAAAYSGGVVLARGMNTLAFSNHMLSDVFALTAFLREARDHNSQFFSPEILAAWDNVGGQFLGSGLPKFDELGPAIIAKVPLEQQLVDAYSDWAAAASAQILPVMETILAQELIPQYQRAVVSTFPEMAQAAAMEIAQRNGGPDRGQGRLLGVLWRCSGELVGGPNEWMDRTIPAVDPEYNDFTSEWVEYVRTARHQRKSLATLYLRHWNNEAMYFFDREAKMSQFANLWRSFTCGYLEELLEKEYRYTNLPHVIRNDPHEGANRNPYLERNYTFVAVAYRRKLPKLLPGLFKSPADHDELAYAAVRVFVPHRRFVWRHVQPSHPSQPIGGVPGDFPDLPIDGELPAEDPTTDGGGRWTVGRQSVPTHWDLLNQHWTCQLVPATQPALAQILQTDPGLVEFVEEEITVPQLGDLQTEEILSISPH